MVNGLRRSCRLAAPVLVALAMLGHMLVHLGAAAAQDLPPPVGPEEPRVAPLHEERGLYSQRWFQLSFLDLRDDFSEAKAEGKRFAVVFEQRGCPYCAKLHNEVLAIRYIND